MKRREPLDRLARDMAPLVCPVGWRREPDQRDGPVVYRSDDGLLVLMSACLELDGCAWLHVSLSRRDRLPSYGETCNVKALFVGDHRKAIQVFPAKSEHVNVHPHCLHLWACLSADPLPDFTGGEGIV